MLAPAVILILSLLGLAASFGLPGASDGLVIALPCALASLFLLLRAWKNRRAKTRKLVILDGSNVMHWKDGAASLDVLREVIRALKGMGLTPSVIFDANAGYKLAGHYMNERSFARYLKLPVSYVLVAPKGTPADPLILQAARGYGAKIVTKDRFRDWLKAFPEISNPDLFIRGRYDGGRLILDTPLATASAFL